MDHSKNLTVGQLKELLKGVPDDYVVATTCCAPNNTNIISGLQNIRTVGDLSCTYEGEKVLCLAPAAGGIGIDNIIRESHCGVSIRCNKVLF